MEFLYIEIVSEIRPLCERWVEMKVGFLISDFHVFETEVQMIMDLMGRKTKILVRIPSGKDPHGIIILIMSDITASLKRERERQGFKLKSCRKGRDDRSRREGAQDSRVRESKVKRECF